MFENQTKSVSQAHSFDESFIAVRLGWFCSLRVYYSAWTKQTTMNIDLKIILLVYHWSWSMGDCYHLHVYTVLILWLQMIIFLTMFGVWYCTLSVMACLLSLVLLPFYRHGSRQEVQSWGFYFSFIKTSSVLLFVMQLMTSSRRICTS